MENLDVLVVGAGPVGLALGCALLRQGVSCRVIDSLAEPVIYSKAAVVHARTMEIFEKLGVAASAREHAKIIHGVSAYAEGKRVAQILFDEVDSPFPYAYGISQHDTEAILGQRLAALGGTLTRSLQLQSFIQDADGVLATLVSADGTQQHVRSRWLVGCDGAHSTVRHVLDLAFPGAPYEEKIVQTDAVVEWPRQVDDDEILAFLQPDGPVACFPFFKDGRYRVLKMYTGEAPDSEPTLATFQQLMEAELPGIKLRDPAWIIGFRIHHRLVERYRVGRVFLAGDAAHIHSPAGGQGMNTGIQDAHNLAWKLALVTRGIARPELLDSYESERRPMAQDLLRGTDRATRTMAEVVRFRNPLAVGLRNGFLALASRLDFVRSNLTRSLSMVDLNYRHSSIVAQHREPLWRANLLANSDSELPSVLAYSAFGAGPEPGDRAPDVVFSEDASDPARLFRFLSPTQHTLLLFDGEAATEAGYRNLRDIAGRVQKRCGDAVISYLVVPKAQAPESAGWDGPVLPDPQKALHTRYGARAECLYLIRPDGYIGYRCQPADGDKLLAYLGTLLMP
jgi:2-polyprenyl-6-methoxyphenol hydroxylase-like FAD-dependent oxidoreductase